MNTSGSNSESDCIFQPLSKTKRSAISQLSQSKRRRKERQFIVEGPKIIADILDRKVFEPLWLGGTEKYLKLHKEDLIYRWSVPNGNINLCSPADLKFISTLSSPSEVIAVFRMPSFDNEDFLNKPLPSGLYLLLDGVQDPGNLGTIVRTAHWFGIDKIFASQDTVDIYNSKTIQSTMGSIGCVQVIYTDLIHLIELNPHIPAVGLQLHGENLFASKLPKSAMICMGSEGNGLSPELQKKLKYSYTIPPVNPTQHPESLNVAIATAITLSQFCC